MKKPMTTLTEEYAFTVRGLSAIDAPKMAGGRKRAGGQAEYRRMQPAIADGWV
jgi:hypothetical protein